MVAATRLIQSTYYQRVVSDVGGGKGAFVGELSKTYPKVDAAVLICRFAS